MTADAVFEPINRGYDAAFCPERLSVGLVVPIEAYPSSSRPSLRHHLERVQRAEALGFRAVWLRDVPFDVPSFGDAGQVFDPFVYLGHLAATTTDITLGVASTILPLRHPAHVAKAAASADVLSEGRLVLGIASGDRPEEYPARNVSFADRGARFRASYDYLRRAARPAPRIDNTYGRIDADMELLPRPTGPRLPLLLTGHSQQSPEWVARHGDGWITYPRPVVMQREVIAMWRNRVAAAGRRPLPAMQSLYVDLLEDANAPAEPIHLGYRLGHRTLRNHLEALRDAGVNHVALNLRFQRADVETALERLAADVLPTFHQ
ncbi:MAG: LLM class oxidoreductase [Myxococcota bacterium]